MCSLFCLIMLLYYCISVTSLVNYYVGSCCALYCTNLVYPITHLLTLTDLDITAFEQAELGRLGMPQGMVMRHRPAHFARE